MTQALLLLTVLSMAGCASVGPATVMRDRFDYTAAVAESWKSQMLLNLVKLRYGDTPVFLDVGQIISGYTMEGRLSVAGTITSSHGVVPGVPDSSVLLGAQGRYTDRPIRRRSAPGGRLQPGAKRRNDLCLSMNEHSSEFTEGERPGGKAEG
jgi:hypothetical protein